MTSRIHRCNVDHRGAHGEGTHSCYSLCGCRCWPCVTARSDYDQKRHKANAYGKSLMVDAEPVREHVRSLMCKGKRGAHHKGVGLKQIVKVSGVAQGTLWKLMYGAPDRKGPSRKVRRATAEKLLAVTFDDVADGTSLPGRETLRQVDEMVAGGFAKAELARYLTGNPKAYALQVGQSGRVSAGNARKIEELYRRWKAGEIAPYGKWSRHRDGPPPVTPRETGLHLEPGERRGAVVRVDCEDCGERSLAGGRWCWPCFKARASGAPDTGCGTDAGYAAHRRRGEDPCVRCRDAHASATRERREVAA
jgi:hypothetical protein